MSTPLIPIDLHCEQRVNPLGIDARTPRLGWALDGGGRGAVQTAYQIQVGKTAGAADAWDSGKDGVDMYESGSAGPDTADEMLRRDGDRAWRYIPGPGEQAGKCG